MREAIGTISMNSQRAMRAAEAALQIEAIGKSVTISRDKGDWVTLKYKFMARDEDDRFEKNFEIERQLTSAALS